MNIGNMHPYAMFIDRLILQRCKQRYSNRCIIWCELEWDNALAHSLKTNTASSRSSEDKLSTKICKMIWRENNNSIICAIYSRVFIPFIKCTTGDSMMRKNSHINFASLLTNIHLIFPCSNNTQSKHHK